MIDNSVFILLSMIFAHIVDDYYLQGILAKLKSKDWWRSNEEYTDHYKYDYIVGLVCHAFSWSFMIMLPIAIYYKFQLGWIYVLYPINLIIHAIVDHLKCNKKILNLVQDQLIHLAQVLITFVLVIALL